jgi:hypothetical protein
MASLQQENKPQKQRPGKALKSFYLNIKINAMKKRSPARFLPAIMLLFVLFITASCRSQTDTTKHTGPQLIQQDSMDGTHYGFLILTPGPVTWTYKRVPRFIQLGGGYYTLDTFIKMGNFLVPARAKQPTDLAIIDTTELPLSGAYVLKIYMNTKSFFPTDMIAFSSEDSALYIRGDTARAMVNLSAYIELLQAKYSAAEAVLKWINLNELMRVFKDNSLMQAVRQYQKLTSNEQKP